MATDSPLRERLATRPDVPLADVDDVIGIAARRQDEARRAAEGATRAELEAVASELDIAPEHVEAAIEELRERRRAEARAAEVARVEGAARRARARSRALGAVVAVLAGMGLVAGAAGVGARGVDAAERAAHAAEARVDAVLARQAALAPQLAGLAGADGAAISALVVPVRDAPTLDARLAAADELSLAMARALGALAPPTSDAEATLRLQLHDELTGSQNRVSVELGRYREAEAAWRDAADGGLGGLAVGLGWADAPTP